VNVGTCAWCGEVILEGEATAIKLVGCDHRFHRECMLRSIVGSVAHQTRRCSCYGGTEDDPPGLTKREAARKAFELFTLTHRSNN
jgi:hypothetical protein